MSDLIILYKSDIVEFNMLDESESNTNTSSNFTVY